jgi:hypothetical protein
MKNMKTLLERLEPELKNKLDRIEELYPNTVEEIMKELQERHYYPELSFNCVMDLVMYLELKNHEPLTIKDLFREEE